MNKNRLLNASLDTVIRFKSNHFPLKTAANDIIKARKLNSSERKVLYNLVFTWAKESLLKEFLSENIRFFKGMPEQKKDLLVLAFIASKLNYFPEKEFDELLIKYEAWLKDLGQERYLKSLFFIGEILKKDHPDIALSVAESLFARPKKYLAIDERYVSLEQVVSELKKLGIDAKSHAIFKQALEVSEINLKDLPLSISSHVWLMDAGSQIIAELLAVKPEDDVLDMCAGEGGKALFITMKLCNYVAMDIDQARLKIAKSRLHKNKVEFICDDACTKDFGAKKFDWILLDAPCSGTGVLRRNPDLVHRLTKKDLTYYIELQKRLLKKAVDLLKPNGKLIYATCSLFKAENEEQIERVLRENKEIKPLPLREIEVVRLKLNNDILVNNCLTLYPHIHDCDGFFVAALTKIPSL
jgi:16S rRNA C967 or C1407 C5-methylase (RsmB/RsmF family)